MAEEYGLIVRFVEIFRVIIEPVVENEYIFLTVFIPYKTIAKLGHRQFGGYSRCSELDLVTNRKLCACIRRMSADDLESYIAGKVTLSSLMEKYEKQRRLNVRLSWACTKQTMLTIDTTIYDLDYETEMSFTKILDAVLLEDGPAYIQTFVNEVFYTIPDLSPDQKAEIDLFVEKAKRLAEIEAK